MPVTGVWMGRISPARIAAFDAIEAVAGGAYASDALRERSRDLQPRDAALASQIVFGCLRRQAQLDYLIWFYSGRKAESLDLALRISLRAAIFQLRFLERIPPHAAVHEAVELVKWRRRAAAGLANAVLRKVNRNPVAWPNSAVELSAPEWLLTRWREHFGAEAARRIALAALEEPQAYIRIPPGSPVPAGAVLEATGVEGCFRLESPVAPGMRLHDIGSQAILPLLDLRPANSYLDLCAAPGNKTLQALESRPGLAVACDISHKRIGEIPAVCPRVVLDATRPLPFAGCFDRIFIDAPCSGTGTLGRNPEIKWRVQEQDFARFRARQLEIVLTALPLLAPEGKLLYATCSLEREENEAVIQEALTLRPGLRQTAEMWRVPGREEGDGFYAALLEGRTDTR